MTTRNLDLGLAASNGVTVLPDVTVLPTVNQILAVTQVTGTTVRTGFRDPSVATVGGPYLPLSGGAVSGSVSMGAAQPNYITIAGGAAGSPATITTVGPWGDLDISPTLQGRLHTGVWRNFPSPNNQWELARWDYIMGGTAPSGQQNAAEVHAVNNDTVDASANSGLSHFSFAANIQAGAKGGRTGFGMNLNQTGATTIAGGEFYVGGAFWVNASANAGGSAGSTAGNLFGSNDLVKLHSGATYWEELCGYELDLACAAGAGCSYKHGIKIIVGGGTDPNGDAVAGSAGKDTAYSLSSAGPCAGWDVGYAFGDGYGWWPMKAAGTLIGTVAGKAGGPAYTAAWGIDLSAVTFSGGLIRGPGFSVDGSGRVSMTGGTVSGGIRGMADQNLGAGGTFNSYLAFASSISGVRTGGDADLFHIVTNNDTLDAGAGGLVASWIDFTSGGAGTSGNRIAQYIRTNFKGSTLDKARGYPSQYGGQWVYAHASGNAGGTSTSDVCGTLWGGILSATLQAGATYWGACIGLEINLGVSTGASATYVQGLKIAVQNHNQVSIPSTDFLFGMGKVALSDAQFTNGIMFGTFDGYWPILSTGTLIGSQPCGLATPQPYTAANGVDFSAVTFSGSAFKSTGFAVSGTGRITNTGAAFSGGIDFGTDQVASFTDLSRHIALFSGWGGFSISGGWMSMVAANTVVLQTQGTTLSTPIPFSAAKGIGFFGSSPPATKPVFTGAKGGNTALASVIAALVACGLGSDSTTA